MKARFHIQCTLPMGSKLSQPANTIDGMWGYISELENQGANIVAVWDGEFALVIQRDGRTIVQIGEWLRSRDYTSVARYQEMSFLGHAIKFDTQTKVFHVGGEKCADLDTLVALLGIMQNNEHEANHRRLETISRVEEFLREELMKQYGRQYSADIAATGAKYVVDHFEKIREIIEEE